MAAHALASLADGPTLGLVGPTIDDDVRRLVSRYGSSVVREAVKHHTTAKRGRPQLQDWPELHEIFRADAIEWLQGRDPFRTRSNYSIAKAVADNNSGHSHPATMRRITRKLEQRPWRTFVTAMQLSENAYSYTMHTRAIEELIALGKHSVWQSSLDQARMHIADYTAKMGEAPDHKLTMKDVEEGAKKTLPDLASLGLGGLISLFDNSLKVSGSRTS